jgi:hypothetical protein
MAVFHCTRFYSDINDLTKFIVLCPINEVIDDNDMLQGFVSKEELILPELSYGNVRGLKLTDVTETSYLVEYSFTTYPECSLSGYITDINDMTETRRLPVK